MSFSKLVPPRRKKRVYCSKEAPFPVPIESITDEVANADSWFYYTAYLTAKHVNVHHTGDTNFLYKMGFFGKGNLSRSQPEFNHRFRTARVPHPEDPDFIVQPRVQSRRVYKAHLQWSGKEIGEGDILSNCSDSSVEEEEQMEIENSSLSDEKQVVTEQSGQKSNKCDDPDQASGVNSSDDESEMLASAISKNEGSWDSKAAASWDTEADADFWGIGDGNKTSSNKVEDSDFWNTDDKDSSEKPQTDKNEKYTNDISSNKNDFQKDHVSLERTPKSDEPKGSSNTQTNESNRNVPLLTENHKGESKVISQSCDVLGNNDTNHSGGFDTQDIDPNPDPKCESENIKSCDLDPVSTSCDLEEVDLDPECEDDDKDGNVLVIDDSDTESRKRKRPRRKWRPVLKRDTFPIKEHLQLSFEETFFLSYGLGCLVVIDEQENKLNLCELWRRFSFNQKSFLPNYIAYHYYRSKGWVPKTGLKFGCDFIVYKEGPPFYHGSYSVMVRLVHEETSREDTEYTQRHLSWISLSGLNRITEHVAKELMICYVIKPRGITAEQLLSPACIPKFKVQEVLVSRWISSQERQEKAVEEFP